MSCSRRSYREGGLLAECPGRARMPEGGGPGGATYTVPPRGGMRLPRDTPFPPPASTP